MARRKSQQLRSPNSQDSQSELDLAIEVLPARVDPPRAPSPCVSSEHFAAHLRQFTFDGERTVETTVTASNFDGTTLRVPGFVNEFWTAQQRQANSLHEISYRACFKPQLPRFFIERLTRPGDTVYDPFMGRGTTPIEAALLGRVPFASDINPLSILLTRPRLTPPTLDQVATRLKQIDFAGNTSIREDLLVFYHPDTLRELSALRAHLSVSADSQTKHPVDDWIFMVALNRLTGHSKGFFSVYTLPPNQAVSIKSQQRINEKRQQTPDYRSVPALILKKSRQLLSECSTDERHRLSTVAGRSQLLVAPAFNVPALSSASVDLVVTSPPFLNIVQYATDNWLRCWFAGIDANQVAITMDSKVADWQRTMTGVFRELHRIVRPRGHVAFEVGEVFGGSIKLDEAVLPCAVAAGFEPVCVVINAQEFTKTANCWGINNNASGTNTNRIVVLKRPD